MMNLEQLAIALIKEVGGIHCEQNIEGVVSVLEGVKRGIDESWENYLYNKSNDALFVHNTKCTRCGLPLKITRHRDKTKVEKR